MKCLVAKRLMSSYLDSAVTRSQLAQVNEHLHDCEDCAADYERSRNDDEIGAKDRIVQRSLR